MTVRVRRFYDERGDGDGTRVLVDRVWPRGVRRDDPRYDEWITDVAPSSDLRTWYGHDPDRFDEFRRRYLDELDAPDGSDAVDRLRAMASAGPLTLLTATRSPEISQAEVLRELLDG